MMNKEDATIYEGVLAWLKKTERDRSYTERAQRAAFDARWIMREAGNLRVAGEKLLEEWAHARVAAQWEEAAMLRHICILAGVIQGVEINLMAAMRRDP